MRKNLDSGNNDPTASARLKYTKSKAEEHLNTRITIGEELLNRPINNQDELDIFWNDFSLWDNFNRELLMQMFDSRRKADEYKHSHMSFGGGGSFADNLKDARRAVNDYLQAIRSIALCLPIIELAPGVADIPKAKTVKQSSLDSREVFVVHGHDNGTKESVARFLGKLELKPIILHEQSNRGRTILEKLEDHSDVGFAVVLLTCDDLGKEAVDTAELRPRARQNVILEFGLFIGKLGRDRVCALYEETLEYPSDLAGLLCVPLDSKGHWQIELAREIKASGIDIDLNKAF